MRCPYDGDCVYTTDDPNGDGRFHLIFSHNLTAVGAKLYEWEATRGRQAMKRLNAVDFLHIYRMVQGDLARMPSHVVETCEHCTHIKAFIISLLPVIDVEEYPETKIVLRRCAACRRFKGNVHECPE